MVSKPLLKYDTWRNSVASPRASGERLSEISRVLASDEFQGRSMGTIGEEKTIAYLVEQFKSFGLAPGGDLMRRLTQRLPGRHVLLNDKIDGTFPAHHPDPTVAKNLVLMVATLWLLWTEPRR